MRLEADRIESIIRYWVLLEEVKHRKEMIFGKATPASTLTFWRTPEEVLTPQPQFVPQR